MHTSGFRAAWIAGLVSACVPGVGPRDAGAHSPEAAIDAATEVDAASLPGLDFEHEIVLDDDAVVAIDPGTLPSAPTACRAPELVRVAWAIDGDTLDVDGVGTGVRERVRVIGVDSPEIAHDPGTTSECYGPESAAFTETLRGHLVWLTFESGCLDRYDRTLAHVHVAAEAEGSWARQLLRRGLAKVLVVSPNRAFESQLRSDEASAQSAARGLWGACD